MKYELEMNEKGNELRNEIWIRMIEKANELGNEMWIRNERKG